MMLVKSLCIRGEEPVRRPIFVHVFKGDYQIYLFCGPELDENMLPQLVGNNSLFNVEVKKIDDTGRFVIVLGRAVLDADPDFLDRLLEHLEGLGFEGIKPQ